MIVNANLPQTAIDEAAKREAAAGKNHAQPNCGSEFLEILKEAAASSDKPGGPMPSINLDPLEMRNREASSFIRRSELLRRSSRSADKEEEEIRRKVQAIWMRFIMTGTISAADLRFLAQHAPNLYMRALEMMQKKTEPKEAGDVPDNDETVVETTQNDAAAESGAEANTVEASGAGLAVGA